MDMSFFLREAFKVVILLSLAFVQSKHITKEALVTVPQSSIKTSDYKIGEAC